MSTPITVPVPGMGASGSDSPNSINLLYSCNAATALQAAYQVCKEKFDLRSVGGFTAEIDTEALCACVTMKFQMGMAATFLFVAVPITDSSCHLTITSSMLTRDPSGCLLLQNYRLITAIHQQLKRQGYIS